MAKRSRTAAERAGEADRLRTRPARAQLLAAARELATARGYESLRVGDIATAAGVSRETFYTHFADKRSCLAEGTNPRLGEVESRLRIALEAGEQWAAPIMSSLEDVLQERYGSRTSARGRIIDAVLRLVAERGYASTRLMDVIKEAKVSYPSFYRHFESKDDCFAASVDVLSERASAELEISLTEDAAPATRLIVLARWLATEPQAAKIMAVEAQPGVLSGVIGDDVDVLVAGAFQELLRRAIRDARIDRLADDVAAISTHVFHLATDAGRRGAPAAPWPRTRRPGSRSGAVRRPSSPAPTAGAPR